MRGAIRWVRRAGLAAALSAAAGCPAGPDDGRVTVATHWPAAARARFGDAAGAGKIRWIALAPVDDPTRLVDRRDPPDLILGGSGSSFEGLRRRGRLLPPATGAPSWRVARRGAIGFESRGGADPDTPPDPLAFDDPRRDPVALSWLRDRLATGPWAGGYARLVLDAAEAATPGRQPGAALAEVRRGDAGHAPVVRPHADALGAPTETPETRASSPVGWVEGVALVRGARHPAEAREVLDSWSSRGLIEPMGHAAEPPAAAVADDLLADLLGATLVDARDELREAAGSLRAAGNPPRLVSWLCEAPPWPPASVAKLLAGGPASAPLAETLAAQVAPGTDSRAWLRRTWRDSGRPIDGDFLRDLAGADGGRLASEPRFRAWLRGEWTAWARQRYRRVARTAANPPATPPLLGGPPG